ncbi:MAG: hypothetical protein M0027_08930 [Candidatus Dormibacteraeota bacterium]|nr:hypothetical protein [Candidatus Dormibacteraeota bacterium]
MRIAGEALGKRGAVALSVAAAAAAILAVHGYTNPGALGLAGGGALTTGHGPKSSPSSGSGATSKVTPSPSASPTSSPGSQATPGPLLSQTSYAAYTYQLYPGSPSAMARQAMAGFTYSAKRAGGSVNFTLYVSGGGQSPISKTYPASDHIYFVEANLGDDSGNSEYNFGDDGLIATDASGHVVP